MFHSLIIKFSSTHLLNVESLYQELLLMIVRVCVYIYIYIQPSNYIFLFFTVTVYLIFLVFQACHHIYKL